MGPWLFRYRIPLSFYPLIALSVYGIVFPPLLPESTGVRIFWLALFAAGLALRAWGSSLLHSAVVVDAEAHADRLVDRGPFALARNPLYTGAGLMILALIAPLPWPLVAVYMTYSGILGLALALYEEALFTRTFGPSYADYLARTGRFLPDWFKFARWRCRDLKAAGPWRDALLSEATFVFYGVALTLGSLSGNARLLYGGVVLASFAGGFLVKRFAGHAKV